MEVKEIINEITARLADKELEVYRKEREADKDTAEFKGLEEELNKVLDSINSIQAETVESYLSMLAFQSQRECRAMYRQGVKDCFGLMKEMGEL